MSQFLDYDPLGYLFHGFPTGEVMKWMVGEASLDEVQLEAVDEIVENIDGNHWVKGFPGTGKTIVLATVINRLVASRSRLDIAFATYTHALKHMVETGLSASARARVHFSTLTAIKKHRGVFDVLVADEMQDINAADLSGMMKKSRAFVVAADFDQSIYPAAAGDRSLAQSLKPYREHELQTIYRINENVFNVATAVYQDAYSPASTVFREDTSRVKLYKGSSARDEFVTMFDEANRVASRGKPSVILFPTWKTMDNFLRTIAVDKGYSRPHLSVVDDRDPYVPGEDKDPFKSVNAWLRRSKAPLQILGSGAGDLEDADSKKMVYLMTYHSVKGLEFSNVFMPHLTEGTSLFAFKGGDSDDERRIFFVAATRAMETLYLSYHGSPHEFIGELDNSDVQKFVKRKDEF